MAKRYRALSNIEHGVAVEDGNQITYFPYGSIVEGLDKDTMKNLWDAGVLEEVEDAPTPVVSKTVTTSTDPTKSGVTSSDPTKGDGGSTPPAAPDNTSGSPKP